MRSTPSVSRRSEVEDAFVSGTHEVTRWGERRFGTVRMERTMIITTHGHALALGAALGLRTGMAKVLSCGHLDVPSIEIDLEVVKRNSNSRPLGWRGGGYSHFLPSCM